MSGETFSYDALAEGYARGVDDAPYNAHYERPAMLALLPPLAGARVLDAGCGSGWYAERLIERGARVTAIDGSAAMVEQARPRLEPLATAHGAGLHELRVADLTRPLDFAADGEFDGIISPLVLHYLRDWGATLAELRRVLRPGGWLVFSTHHPAAEAVRLRVDDYFAVQPVEDDWGWLGKVRFFRRSLGAISGALADAGFVIERLVEPIPTDEFRRLKPETYERLLRLPDFILFLAR